MPSLGGWEIVIILGVLVLLFGAKRLPDMARSIGQSARVFKGEMKGMKNDDPEAAAAPAEPANPPAAPSALPAASPTESAVPPAQAPATQNANGAAQNGAAQNAAAQNASGKPGGAAQ